jgi:Polysaccharide lyase family 4, domain II
LLVGNASPAAYEVTPGLRGGMIQGVVRFTAPVPPSRRVIPTKNREVCGDEVREIPEIVVGRDGVVQGAIVYLKDAARGKPWDARAKNGAIENRKCDFTPYVQVVPLGDFDIVNADPILHNTHGFLGRVTMFNVALPDEGRRITKRLQRSGLVRVVCDTHDWMRGWVYVADNPYYALTPTDGRFALADVPPGTYTLVGWQPYTGAVELPITVKAGEVTTISVDLAKP